MLENDGRVESGILPGTEIESHLNELMAGGSVDCVESCSYDMRVGTIFCGLDRISDQTAGSVRSIQIQPGEFVYLYTAEELQLADNVSATAYAINSLSSRGLLVLNPGHVDPGFRGPLTVTAWNLNNQPQTIEVGDKIITVLFTRLSVHAKAFARNRSRDEREKAFTKHVSGEASKGIGELIRNNIRSPIATKEDLDATKRELDSSASNRLALMIAIASMVLAIVGLILAIFSITQSGGEIHQEFHTPQPMVNVSPRSIVPSTTVDKSPKLRVAP